MSTSRRTKYILPIQFQWSDTPFELVRKVPTPEYWDKLWENVIEGNIKMSEMYVDYLSDIYVLIEHKSESITDEKIQEAVENAELKIDRFLDPIISRVESAGVDIDLDLIVNGAYDVSQMRYSKTYNKPYMF
jgi:hypothetical protein